MSDFGTTILAKKEDNSNFSSDDISDLSSKLKSILKDGEYGGALGDDFNHQFGEIEGSKSIIVQLSEYYYGNDDDENEESFEFVKDVELDQALELVEMLSMEFPDYRFEANVEEW